MNTDTQHPQAIDWQQCLSLANNNTEIADDLLTLFVSDLPSVRKHLQELFTQEDYSTLKDQAHRLHGATCYCGVPQLKAAVQALEKQLKSETLSNKTINNKEIEALLQTLFDEIDRVITAFTSNNFRQVTSET